MHPRLIVVQPSHAARDTGVEAGQWAIQNGVGAENRQYLGAEVRLCVLSLRSVARVIYPHDTASMAAGRDPAQDRTATYYDRNSDEYQKIARLSQERQMGGEGQPIYMEGPELLLHIHAPEQVGLATYFASSRSARASLVQGYMPHQTNRNAVFKLTMQHMESHRFQWYAPQWQHTPMQWRGVASKANDIAAFLTPCDPLALNPSMPSPV